MESAFFEGCDVYVDGFNSFTGAQLNLLKLMIERADNFTIALRTDKSGNYYFKQTDKTLLRLEGFARELEKEIREYCNSRLADYKWIRKISFVKSFQKTISGKIIKTELRKAESL